MAPYGRSESDTETLAEVIPLVLVKGSGMDSDLSSVLFVSTPLVETWPQLIQLMTERGRRERG